MAIKDSGQLEAAAWSDWFQKGVSTIEAGHEPAQSCLQFQRLRVFAAAHVKQFCFELDERRIVFAKG